MAIQPSLSLSKNHIAAIGLNPVAFPTSIKAMDDEFQQAKSALSKLNAWCVSNKDFATYTQAISHYLEQLRTFSQKNHFDTSNILNELKIHTKKLLDNQVKRQKQYANEATKRSQLVFKSFATMELSLLTFLFLRRVYVSHEIVQWCKSRSNLNQSQLKMLNRESKELITSGVVATGLFVLAAYAGVAAYLEYKTLKQDHDHRCQLLLNINRQIEFALANQPLKPNFIIFV